jgi:hypothetical protein
LSSGLARGEGDPSADEDESVICSRGIDGGISGGVGLRSLDSDVRYDGRRVDKRLTWLLVGEWTADRLIQMTERIPWRTTIAGGIERETVQQREPCMSCYSVHRERSQRRPRYSYFNNFLWPSLQRVIDYRDQAKIEVLSSRPCYAG